MPNFRTRFLMEQEEIVYTFQSTEPPSLCYDILSKRDPKFRLVAPRPDRGLVSYDFGIVTRMKNAYDPRGATDAVIACGCFGWGTRAAAQALVDPRFVAFVSKKAVRYFQVIVKVTIDNQGMASLPKVLEDTLVPLSYRK